MRVCFFFLRSRPPPRAPLLPYTPLLRSPRTAGEGAAERKIFRHSLQRRRSGRAFDPALDEEAVSETRRSEEHTSELQSRQYLVCRLLLERNTTCRAVALRFNRGSAAASA